MVEKQEKPENKPDWYEMQKRAKIQMVIGFGVIIAIIIGLIAVRVVKFLKTEEMMREIAIAAEEAEARRQEEAEKREKLKAEREKAEQKQQEAEEKARAEKEQEQRKREAEERQRAEALRQQKLAPYYIKVSRNENVMMVYGRSENGKYDRLVKTFVASTGKNNASPLGVWTVDKRYQWRWAEMIGGAQAQYVTRITGPYLMHSVPYYTRHENALKWEEFNKLGQQASMGCVRLQLADAKWIYENVTTGTKVEIYHGSLPEGVVKPVAPKIEAEEARRGWDPTNPLPENPWRK